MYVCSNVENVEKKGLGEIIHSISAKKHILRYMLVGCSRTMFYRLSKRIHPLFSKLGNKRNYLAMFDRMFDSNKTS